ncbi:MAG: PadR family transcriptional regulator [Candidatus Heimdallarchaeaceae archaeon]
MNKILKLVPRGFLRINILKVLETGPKHGYEIMKLVEEISDWKPSPGSVYPSLNKLNDLGFIEKQKIKKRRIYYKITKDGKEFLNDFNEKKKDIKEKSKEQAKSIAKILDIKTKELDFILKTIDSESTPFPREIKTQLHKLFLSILEKPEDTETRKEIIKILKETRRKIAKIGE